MFTNIINNLQIEPSKLWCLSYDTLNPYNQSLCHAVFPQHTFIDDFTLWYVDNNVWILLGYIYIVKNNISSSECFSTFINNSILIEGTDPSVLSNLEAYQIVDWVFDDVLNNMEILTDIFARVSLDLGKEKQTVLLWRDGQTELEYHPITNNGNAKFPSMSVGRYFAERFIEN